MSAVLASVLNGDSPTIRGAALDYGVPVTTLYDRVSGRVQHGTKPGPSCYLSPAEETELESYLVKSAQLGYGKTRCQVKGIAEKVAKSKGILRKKKVTDGWWRRFHERHPKLSLHSGDSTAFVRQDAMAEDNIRHYFDLYYD